MDETRKRFWDTFEQMQEDFDRFFEHYARAKRPSLDAMRLRWSPPCNIQDTGDSIRVLVEIAGMRREALDLRLEEDVLILRGTRCAPPDLPMRGRFEQMEIAFGEFELEIPLAVPVDAEAAQACYREGFLQVVLPKIPAAAKPVRIVMSVPER